MDILKSFHDHFAWFIWTLAALAVFWFFNGGPARETAHQGQYLNPPAPLSSGNAYGTYYAGAPENKKQTLDLPTTPATIVKNTENGIGNFLALSKQAQAIHITSLLSQRISFDGLGGAKASDPKREYLRILASEFATSAISVSGLLIQGTLPGSAVIVPKAVNLPLIGNNPVKADIALPPGGRALITSGPSPVGESFRVNLCTGYFGEAKSFAPDLRRDCPNPMTELEAAGLSSSGISACQNFVLKIPRCGTYQGDIPSNLSKECRTFVTERLTYSGCVANHRNDKDFYFDEWRLFLGEQNELWKDESEIIKLIDGKGKVIDAITY